MVLQQPSQEMLSTFTTTMGSELFTAAGGSSVVQPTNPRSARTSKRQGILSMFGRPVDSYGGFWGYFIIAHGGGGGKGRRWGQPAADRVFGQFDSWMLVLLLSRSRGWLRLVLGRRKELQKQLVGGGGESWWLVAEVAVSRGCWPMVADGGRKRARLQVQAVCKLFSIRFDAVEKESAGVNARGRLH
jgi:hypothetical protein